MSKTIVFGGTGQLGSCLQLVAKEKGFTDIVFLSEEDADILNPEVLQKTFDTHKPAYCINCAAYTAVDKAEDEVEIARKVNKDGAANLAKLCADYHTTLIHVSTDFVFGGNVPALLTEEDKAEPINVYGVTKLEGELVIPEHTKKHYILRTSWLYSEFGNNFVKTMLRLGKERDQLGIIVDQIGTPTYAIDLATVILHIIANDNQQFGTYHYSNEGVTSWFDFAKAIFDLGEVEVKALPLKTSEYPTKAVRPAFSVMDKSKIKNAFGIEIPYWRDSLRICIERLEAERG
ncbi:dTDP-4-dehydrorhamnose reductase [Desertivirga arenae]|uniref:dTDP-4-dehydrorhamnose reductase n=1 Tax=Desertivirga arenae TaxID=2810309 RepID=UPI001A96BE92|nr:dTDP-4-dehydrorhamnose reductase [Pedobacter sp. SYSU D00823]